MVTVSQKPALRWTLALAFLFGGFVLWPSIARAQFTTGSISGTVTDPQNLIIPEVRVTITSQETEYSRSTGTNEVGFYSFPALDPGVYILEFSRAGLDTLRTPGIKVSTAQGRTFNARLIPSVRPDVVEITAMAGIDIIKTNATIEQTLYEREVDALPLALPLDPTATPRRDITNFAPIGVMTNRSPGQTGFQAFGQRVRNNNFTVDGVENNDNTVTVAAAHPPPESVKELQIQTAMFSAEFGKNTGARLSIITKNGTKDYHGEFWNYYTANWLQPLSLANKIAGINKTPRSMNNEFGGSLGGPVIRKKTFFFGLVEGDLFRQGPTANNAASATIPTRIGYAALQSAPLRSGQSQASRDAVLQALSFLPGIYDQISAFDADTGLFTTVNDVPIQLANAVIPLAQPANMGYGVFRIDHYLAGADRITYRYLIDYQNQQDFNSNTRFGTKWTARNYYQTQNHNLSFIKVAKGLVNEIRLAYQHLDAAFPENDPVSPTIDVGTLFRMGGNNEFPQERKDSVYQVQSISSVVHGRHSLRFGLDIRRNSLNSPYGLNTKGYWEFSSLQDFMNNTATRFTKAINSQVLSLVQWNQAYFLQDDLKVTRGLTLNLGLRYETSSVPFGMFGATTPELLAMGAIGPTRRDKNNLAPRVSFAYSPENPSGILKTLFGEGISSLRGGFSVGYDVLYYNIIANTAATFPRTFSAVDALPATTDEFPASTPTSFQSLSPISIRFINTPVDAQSPTTNSWSLSFQRELGKKYVLELGYAGNRSYHLIRLSESNPAILTPAQAAVALATQAADVAAGRSSPTPPPIPSSQERRVNPEWGRRTVVATDGEGEYHAGYIKLDRKLSRGLTIGANYTWSANISDSDEILSGDILVSSPGNPQDFFSRRSERSRSAFDRPHRFSLHYVYELPWFANSGPRLRQVLGGWQFSGFTEYQAGQPFTIIVGADTVGNTLSAGSARPDSNPGGVLNKDPYTRDLRTFTIPGTNSLPGSECGTGIVTMPAKNIDGSCALLSNSMPRGGTLGRNTLRGPAFQNWDFSIMKKVRVSEKVQLQLRSDFSNLFNHTNFRNPVANMSSANFGKNIALPYTDSRQIVFSAKLKF